jgi:hypothetical protein
MFSAIQSNPTERKAFFDLLDQYFNQSTPSPSASTSSSSGTTTRTTPPIPASRKPITSTKPEPIESNLLRTGQSTNTTHNAISGAVLKNSSFTSAALRNAGLSAGQADAASKFGAKNSEKLAPYASTAASTAYANKSSIANGANSAYVRGQAPSGLTSGKGFGDQVNSLHLPSSSPLLLLEIDDVVSSHRILPEDHSSRQSWARKDSIIKRRKDVWLLFHNF